MSEPKSSDSGYLQRVAAVERRFRGELIKQLPSTSCIVQDIQVFSDPANYPALKGSVLFEISALPSLRNADVAAIAVGVSSNQGAYFEQNIPLLTQPVIIEQDSDYALGAKLMVHSWTNFYDTLAHTSRKP